MIVGIDLGTTNSVCAVWRDGAAVLVPNALGDFLTPSAVNIDARGQVAVGLAARDRQVTDPQNTATVFKRRMGTRATAQLQGRQYSAEELSSLVLASLKADAEAFLGEAVAGAVITVPAYFNDKQRKATRRAGELAGLKVERLINEPTAAALAFGIQDRAEHEPFLVFDLGGGTFDVSIVEMYDGIVEVRASAGDNRLGGEDFNAVLIDLARPRIDPDGLLATQDAMVVEEVLRAAAERCRRALSDADAAEFAVTFGDQRLAAAVTAAEFEAQAAGLLARLRDPVLRSLRDSDIRVDALSEVVLVGGATRMPIVRRAITRMFGRFPNQAVHPDHAVALGAAAQAGLLARDGALEEIRLTDVCPFTLGVAVSDRDARGRVRHGLFSPIIDRNTPIPVSRAQYYSPTSSEQRIAVIEVYQGEARDVVDNVRLGTLRVPLTDSPFGTGSSASVECRFTYDTSGMLEVDVCVSGADTTHNLVVMDGEEQVDADELARRRERLAALKHHPRDAAENVALLARAQRCYEAFLGEARDVIHRYLTDFESALADQHPRSIALTRDALSRTLDVLEGERFL